MSNLRRFRDDPRFAIENLYRVLDLEKGQVVPMRFNEAQIRLYELNRWFHKNALPVRIIVCKARRAGLSTVIEAIIYHAVTHTPNTNALIVANERNPSENVLEMCRKFWRFTPLEFQPPLPDAFRNNPPKDRLVFEGELHSNIFVATARSIDSYLGFGITHCHATEVAYYKDGPGLFRAILPTIVKSANSSLYLESTPNGQVGDGQFFYDQVMDAHERRGTKGEYGVTRLLFIPWHEMTTSFTIAFPTLEKRELFIRSITKDENDFIKQYAVSPEQLLWRRSIMAQPPFNKDPEIFDQEYPGDLATAFISSGQSVFSRKSIKRLSSRTRAPKFEGDMYWGDNPERNERENIADTVKRPRFLTAGEAIAAGFTSHTNERSLRNLKVWRWPVKGERLFIAGDVGGGDSGSVDGDYSILKVGVLNDYAQDEVIITWRGHLNPLLFGEIASALAWRLYALVGENVAAPLLAIEWQGPGVACNTYIDTKNLYFNTYRYQAPGVHGMPKSKHIGWESNAKTKPLMVGYTQRVVEADLIDEPDETTVIEMSSYRKLSNFSDESSYGGAAGRHDDNVSALQILIMLLRLNAGTGEPSQVLEVDNYSSDPDDIAFDRFREFSDDGSVSFVDELEENDFSSDVGFYRG